MDENKNFSCAILTWSPYNEKLLIIFLQMENKLQEVLIRNSCSIERIEDAWSNAELREKGVYGIKQLQLLGDLWIF